jgi:hypothetical protein
VTSLLLNKTKKKKSRSRARAAKSQLLSGGVEAAVARILHPPTISAPQRTEVKYFDVTTAIANVSSAGQITKLNAVPQGAGVSSRIGDELLVKKVSLRLYLANSIVASQNAVRVIVFQWLLSDSVVAPSLLGVLKNSGTAADYPIQPYNLANVEQEVFAVYLDESFAMDNVSETTKVMTRELTINSATRYDAAAVTGQGCLYLLIVSGQGVNGVNVNWSSRLLYTDA